MIQSCKVGNFAFSESEPTTFMKLQREMNFEPMKFIDVFSGARNSRPENFVFFVSTSDECGWLSNWFGESGHFGKNNVFFPTAEHELMYRKAAIFNGGEHVEDNGSVHPRTKKIGRQVHPFNEQTWKIH